MDIYVLAGREQLGPFTLEEINDKLVRGELTASTLAWFEGSSEWTPLRTVSGVNVSTASVRPPPPPVSEADSPPRPGNRAPGSTDAVPPSDDARATPTNADAQQHFYEQLAEAFRTATGHLMEPFDTLSQTVQAKKAVNMEKFFRLFLQHAARFNDECATAFATVLRHSTHLDAVRATTVKQLAKEIQAEVFEECDAALNEYQQTVDRLLGGVESIANDILRDGAPMGALGGALLGGLVAGRGSRVAGSLAGGVVAHSNAMRTLNQQGTLLVEAQMMLEQAQQAAPAQVGQYLDAVAAMPEPLVDFLGAKCFGAAADLEQQQLCARACWEYINGLNTKAVAAVKSACQQNEDFASAAARKAQEESEARAERNGGYLTGLGAAAIAAVGMVVLAFCLYKPHEPDGGGMGAPICGIIALMLAAVACYFYSNIEV